MTKILSNDITTIKSIIYSSQPLLTYSGRKFVYIDDKGQKQKYTLNQAILTLKELEKIQPIEVIPLKAKLLSKYKESEKLSFNSSFQKICVRISQFIGNYLFKYSHGKIDREAFLVTNSEKFSSVVPTQNFHVPNIYFDLVPRDVTGIVRNYVNHSNLYELVKEFEDLMSCFDKLVASYKKNIFINSFYLEKYDNLKLDLKKFAHHVFYSLFNIRDVH